MKKSTLLSLATAGAIVATSMGTFAAWDVTTSTTAVQSLTLGKAVNLQADLAALSKDAKTDINTETGESVTGTVTVDLSTVSTDIQTGRKVEITPIVAFKDGSSEVNGLVAETDYTVEVKKGNDVLTPIAGVATDTPTTFDTDTNQYTIKVTPKNSEKLSGKTVEISAKVELK